MKKEAMNTEGKKIRILLVTRPLVPPWDEASKNFAYFLAKSISDPDLEFHLLTAGEKLEGVGDNCIEHPIFQGGTFDFEAKTRLAIFLATKARSFDIVHFLFTPTPVNAFLSKILVGKKPKTIQTIATLREERWGAREWKRIFFANHLVTYTDHSKKKLQEAGFQNVERIYPGIDLERFSPKPKDPETLVTLNLSPDDFVVSYVGEYARLGATDMIADMLVRNLSKNRVCHSREGGNPDTTSSQETRTSTIRTDDTSNEWNLDPRLRGGDGNIKFLFALRVKNEADQKKKEEIQERFREAGILDSIRFSDTVSDVENLYNIADIITFPVADMHGKFDVPLVILEAYASGRPVILSDLPLFREFSNPHISATIPRGDGDALWRKIDEIQKNEEIRYDFARSAREFVKNNYDLSQTAKEYKELYKKI